MTKRQYENLKLGDLVTKYTGPNKGKIMIVIKKYLSFDGTPCIKVVGFNKGEYIYHQNKVERDGAHTCGAASCFKVLG